jgi:hypothetical protein
VLAANSGLKREKGLTENLAVARILNCVIHDLYHARGVSWAEIQIIRY